MACYHRSEFNQSARKRAYDKIAPLVEKVRASWYNNRRALGLPKRTLTGKSLGEHDDSLVFLASFSNRWNLGDPSWTNEHECVESDTALAKQILGEFYRYYEQGVVEPAHESIVPALDEILRMFAEEQALKRRALTLSESGVSGSKGGALSASSSKGGVVLAIGAIVGIGALLLARKR